MKSNRPVMSRSPRKKMSTIACWPVPIIHHPTHVRIADQRSLVGTGDIISARFLCSRSLIEAIWIPLARAPSMIIGKARTVSRRSPPPSCKRMMFPQLWSAGEHGGKCSSTKLVICSALRCGFSRQSLGSILSPMVRYPMFSEISSTLT